ncbi:hypothetical protein GHT06_022728 [Daphnia sinensis]|uniref:Apple domain-containing protein n=1 Tax=Daphnia sinensis TaxID=1820382 RepID=A0AAD5L795_9CRUS|nr:hypothetical protein GHT06_022728 [Daphnia sinensis]
MAPKSASFLLIALMMGLAVANDVQGEQLIMSERQDLFTTQEITIVSTFKHRCECDFLGNDFGQYFRSDSYTQCATVCANNVSCTHFTYNFVGKYCFLKRYPGPTMSAPMSHPQGICGYFPARVNVA